MPFQRNRHAIWAALVMTLGTQPLLAQFAAPLSIGTRVFTAATGAELLDVNGDGLLDALVTEHNQFGPAGHLRIYPNPGTPDGAFGAPQNPFGVLSRAGRLITADVDQDGIRDVVVPCTLGGTTVVQWYRCFGNGLFGSPVVIDSGPAAQRFFAVSMADMDGDGDLDAAITALDGDTVRYVENTGGGATWGPATVVAGGLDIPFSVETPDLDGDGLPDILAAALGNDRVVWIRNLGGGQFSTAVDVGVPSGGGVTTARAADLDADGAADIVVTRNSSGRLSWFRNLGGGTFGPERTISMGLAGSIDVRAVDIDDDRDLDLIATGGDGVQIYRNLGPGFFEPGQLLPSTLLALRIAVGDIDGDSDNDILAVGDSHVWYRNETLIGASSCASTTNSTGENAVASLTGSPYASDNRVTLTASALPPSTFGFFLASRTQGNVPGAGGSEGVLCLGGSIGRFVGPGEIQSSLAFGRISVTLDLTQMPLSQPVAMAGEAWHFQAWFRDTVAGTVTSNFSDSVTITWF